MTRGILDFLGLAVTVAFAAPLVYAGASMLLEGRTLLGGTLVGIGVAMVLVEEYVVTPGDLPGEIAQRATGKVVAEEDED